MTRLSRYGGKTLASICVGRPGWGKLGNQVVTSTYGGENAVRLCLGGRRGSPGGEVYPICAGNGLKHSADSSNDPTIRALTLRIPRIPYNSRYLYVGVALLGTLGEKSRVRKVPLLPFAS